jgi:hypothetical protein
MRTPGRIISGLLLPEFIIDTVTSEKVYLNQKFRSFGKAKNGDSR